MRKNYFYAFLVVIVVSLFSINVLTVDGQSKEEACRQAAQACETARQADLSGIPADLVSQLWQACALAKQICENNDTVADKKVTDMKLDDKGKKFLSDLEGYAGKLGQCKQDQTKNCSIEKGKNNYGFYNDSSGFCTTGIGKLIAKKSCQAIDKMDKNSKEKKKKDSLAKIKTKADAEKQLTDDLKKYEGSVKKYVHVPLCPAQYTALVSFVYNTGESNFHSSTLLKKLNNKDYEGAATEFAKWTYSNGKFVPGLTERRAKEVLMFESCSPGQ